MDEIGTALGVSTRTITRYLNLEDAIESKLVKRARSLLEEIIR